MAARSVATAFAVGAFFRIIATRWPGARFASSRKGFLATTVAHSLAVRTWKSVRRPRRFSASLSNSVSNAAPVLRPPLKTRLPLLSTERTCANPKSVRRSRRSDIATWVRPPRLTPRSRAMWTVMASHDWERSDSSAVEEGIERRVAILFELAGPETPALDAGTFDPLCQLLRTEQVIRKRNGLT